VAPGPRGVDNPYEIIGTVFGLLSVWLSIRKSVWCWPTGLVNVICFFVMFYQVKLYAELITYAVFFVLGVYGWWKWSSGSERTELAITRTPRRISVALIALALMWAPAQGFALVNYTDASLPYWDSSITVLSLIAQWMMARKYLENWMLWIAVDVLGIGVYQAKGLYVTSGLYVVFLIMATCGLVAWWRALERHKKPSHVPA
jgi:nicotinamide mononucleotide transporter